MHKTSEVFLSLTKLGAKPQVYTSSDKTNVSAFTPNIMKVMPSIHNELQLVFRGDSAALITASPKPYD